MLEVKLTMSQATSMEAFVEDHLNFCRAYLFEELPEDTKFEPYGLYDGCETCDTREFLMATFDWLRFNKLVDVYIEDDEVERSQYFVGFLDWRKHRFYDWPIMGICSFWER